MASVVCFVVSFSVSAQGGAGEVGRGPVGVVCLAASVSVLIFGGGDVDVGWCHPSGLVSVARPSVPC